MNAHWSRLRAFTNARIGLGRAGAGIPTGETLRFQLAHAQARDAVHAALDLPALARTLAPLAGECVLLHSAAQDRLEYLTRPDLGRILNEASRATLSAHAHRGEEYDLALVIADGLSAFAIENNAAPLLAAFLPLATAKGWRLAPLSLVQQGRVAIGDEIGAAWKARCVIVAIGERPGLSSPDSLGLYLTFAPRPGLTDERRNCISNVRPAGYPPVLAAGKLAYLIEEALTRQLSGVDLKDDQPEAPTLPLAPLAPSEIEDAPRTRSDHSRQRPA